MISNIVTTTTIATSSTTATNATNATSISNATDGDLILARANDDWFVPVIATVVAVVVVLLAVIAVVCVARRKRGQKPEAHSVPPALSVIDSKSQYTSLSSIRQSTDSQFVDANSERNFPDQNQYAVIAKTAVTYDSGNIDI